MSNLSDKPTDENLVELSLRLISGDIDQDGLDLLTRKILEDHAFRSRFVNISRIHGHLIEHGKNAAIIPTHRTEPPTLSGSSRLARRPHLKLIAWASAIAALFLLGLTLVILAEAHSKTKIIIPTVADGALTITRDGRQFPAEPGTRLRVGDVIRTEDQCAIIDLHGGRFTLDHHSSAEIRVCGDRFRKINLLSGTITADTLPFHGDFSVLALGSTLHITDALTSISIQGQGAVIRVLRGVVCIDRKDGSKLLIAPDSQSHALEKPSI